MGSKIFQPCARNPNFLINLIGHLLNKIPVFTSCLLNLLLPEHELKVREVSRKRGRGRHTTVGSTFYRLPEGGYVADTPGLQLLVLWDLSPDELAGAFPEFRTAIDDCRFNDCRHVSEPDCAVRRLIETGAASEERYGSYRALLDEATQEAP